MGQIMTGIGDGARWDVSVDYSVEQRVLGTGGALRQAEPFLAEEEFLTLNGDSLVDFDLNAFVAFHKARRALATLVLVQAPPSPSRRYGAVHLDDTGQILGFFERGDIERGRQGTDNVGWINGGVYLFRKEVLGFIPRATQLSLEEKIFPQLVGRDLYGFASAGYFIDIGVPEDYRRAQLELPKRFPPS
jgi:NDP-sugar pyrophosphorylase family protein